ncbi:WXG100 family type VII secretion target [Nocardiopsis chromatogenes]|uniref:WXG100 family type VII secretion target n=1 Tax=Nocardiopsis chromatogenes TaxID=280239 RepID=UPI00035CE984|nr:WXG100 family type VII secretion target [Nocardiopsis chromatogenes]
MSELFRSTDQAMREGKDAMETAHSTCNGIYTQVDSTRDMLGGNWQGGAAARYDTALVKWLEELRLITNDMNDMIGILGGTERNFHEMEDANMVTADWAAQLNPNQRDAAAGR